MKRIFALLLVFTMLLPLVGCSTQPEDIGTDWQFFSYSSVGALSEQGYY